MLHKIIFKTVYSLNRPGLVGCFNKFKKTQWLDLQQLQTEQNQQLRKIINFAYQSVPYYTKLFSQLNIKPSDINTIKDLEKLPTLTKKIIREHWEDLTPVNIKEMDYLNSTTGGSTGVPCRYRMSHEDYKKGVALMYRGWTYAGYNLGDKVATLAGSSLIPTAGSNLKNKIQEFGLNIRNYSSYEMSDKNLFKYFYEINKWRPDFIRGYASSVYLFTRFLKSHNLKLTVRPRAVFTTAEKLFSAQRALIEEVFDTKVFDTYGLNDGGVSAFECEKHNGMHIDAERAILETVDEKNKSITGQTGKILATDLYNYAMPFIRYDTEDLGIISNAPCSCGRKTFLLKEITGRITDYLNLNNVIIGSPVLTVLMGKFDIEQYQIIQNTPSSIVCKIIKSKSYNEARDEDLIRKSFYVHVGEIGIKFVYAEFIPAEGIRKYKFIINNVNTI